MMEDTFSKINVNIYNDKICLKLNVNSEITLHEEKVFYPNIDTTMFIFYWMLKSAKLMFFNMPFDKMDFVCSKSDFQKIGYILKPFGDIIKTTNDMIKTYANLKESAASNKNILFFNVSDEDRYKSLYNMLEGLDGSKLIYMNMDPGFNPLTRQWEKKDIPLSLSDLLKLIEKSQIKKIVSINHYFIEKYLDISSIYMPALFRYLGLEYVIIDNDPCDHFSFGYIIKSFWHCDSFNRFSIGAHYHKYWDNKYDLKNIHYITLPQQYEDSGEIIELKEEYAVLVTSNSRINDLKSSLPSILYLLDNTTCDMPFMETMLWYMSMKHMILQIMRLGEFERIRCNAYLADFIYQVMQILKYEVIESIDTPHKIEIYGDPGWQSIFPQYYQKYLNPKEKDDLFFEKRHLYLLMNHNITYLDSGSPTDAIRMNLPFINYPALVKTKDFEGIKHIEYNDKYQLNYLIENIRTIVKNKELTDSIRAFKDVLSSSTYDLVKQVVYDKEFPDNLGLYAKHRKEHDNLLEQMIEEYIDRNKPFLRETFRALYQGEAVKYNISKSRYFSRKYVQRILKSIRDDQGSAA